MIHTGKIYTDISPSDVRASLGFGPIHKVCLRSLLPKSVSDSDKGIVPSFLVFSRFPRAVFLLWL